MVRPGINYWEKEVLEMKVHEEENAGRLKKSMGVFYTSPLVARKLICLTIDPILANIWRDLPEVLKSIQTHFFASSVVVPPTEQQLIYQPIIECLKPLFTLRVCDPAMGNGIFLVETLRYMLLIYDRITSILSSIPHPPSTLSFVDYQGWFDIFFHTNYFEQLNLLWVLFRGLWTGAEEDRRAWGTYILTHMIYGVDILSESREITIRSILRAYHLWTDDIAFPEFPSADTEPNITQIDILELPELDIITDDWPSVLSKDRLLASKIRLHMVVANSLVSSFSDVHPLPSIWRTSEYYPRFRERMLSIIKIRTEILLCSSEDQIEFLQSQYTIEFQLLHEILSKLPGRTPFSLPNEVIPMDWSVEFPEIFFALHLDCSNCQKPSSQTNSEFGGFSVLLCNPPWKPHQLNEPDFFSKFDPLYPNLSPSQRKIRRAELLEKAKIHSAYENMRAQFALLNTSFGQWYPLQQEKKFNLFKLFLERAFTLLQSGGTARAGWIVPLGLFGEARATLLRTALFQRNAVNEIYHLFSGDDLFPNITDGQPFALFTYTTDKPTQEFAFYPNLHTVVSLSQPLVQITLQMDQLRAISPQFVIAGQNSPMLALPLVNSLEQFLLLEKICQFPRLRNGWGLQAKRELNRTDDVRNGVMIKSPSAIPVLEGKYLVHYGFSVAKPRFYIDSSIDYASYRPIVSSTRIVWRNVSNIRLRRRMFCAVIPPGIATVNSLNYICEDESQFSVPLEGDVLWYLLGLLGSLVAEFQLRIFSTNNNLNQYLIENLALPLCNPSDPLHQHLVALVKDFQPNSGQWADQMVTLGHKSEAKAALTQKYWNHLAEIDAICLKIYGLDSDQFEILQGKFPKLESAYFSMISENFN
ncbi:MAG: hypothetical protein ACTSYI_12910 [Promethearchaeota archaeon]